MCISNRMTDEWYPDVIVLGPGGAKGFLELGALLYLFRRGLLSRVNTYVGVSVGSIIALLKVCGYDIKDIITIAADTDIFKDITQISPHEAKENLGLISNEPIKKKLQECVEKKFGRVPSMLQLYQTTGLTYSSISYNYSKNRSEVHNHETKPEMDCVAAAMLSMNIPFMFYELFFNGDRYVDGALGNPYPIGLYDDGVNNILGMYIESKIPTTRDFMSYVHGVIQAPMTELRKRSILAASARCKHIALQTENRDTTGISFSAQDKADMIIDGFNIAQRIMTGSPLNNNNNIFDK